MTIPNYKGHNSLADMIKPHIHVWRKALEESMPACGPDSNIADIAYYEHELNALMDIENAINSELDIV